MDKLRLLIASTNPGKLREFQQILGEAIHHPATQSSFTFELVLPVNLGIDLNVEEDGLTYADNAKKKAVAFCRASGLITLADDSGLEVEALGGQPGLYSARYAPWPHATDADRRRYLLENLRPLSRPWNAHFHCSLAIAVPNQGVHLTEGKVAGQIIDEERGENGFGYDPIFLLPHLGLTMAELASEEKNRISHRALAVKTAVPLLARLAASN